MTRRDFDLVRRVEALEFAYGVPRRVPILECEECGHRIAELRRPKHVRACPRCGCNALLPVAIELWPPGSGA